ncbi:hypothetical protein RII68_002189 [Vibrio parahaemolyticus]|uniref:hypothetical protein n=2 Tax=Vibrio parahaemolyticus TaxID=670 RepID=UPI0007A0B65B|nr:hypothetical protein [Vibrio parahaemolyticus]EGQ7740035.1 hypothetical protein [Vibrio parahaemolyticus]EGR1767957.1 hypothetical protein [Vibrio parahaemolyticus]EIO3964911.1 hypothetical protein [Vibrio parahaemolyticus]EIO3987692.1 hypothetical protein [Vibrio parahaemolyticus]EJG1396693.1 hypothetical protein [Vibrio parahaemolyticus]
MSAWKGIVAKWHDIKGYVSDVSESVSWRFLYELSNMSITNIATYSTLTIPVLASLVLAINNTSNSEFSLPDSMSWFYYAGFVCVVSKTLVSIFCPAIVKNYNSSFEYACYRVNMDVKAKELANNHVRKSKDECILSNIIDDFDSVDYEEEWNSDNYVLGSLRLIISLLYLTSILVLFWYYGIRYPLNVISAS